MMRGVAKYMTVTLSPDINGGSLTVIQGWLHIFQITVRVGHESNIPTQKNLPETLTSAHSAAQTPQIKFSQHRH